MQSKAHSFYALHQAEKTFIMPNAWDAGSAVILQEAGFSCIATTSAGVAYSRALPDYEGALSLEAALEETQRIVQAVDVPVSMDAENGYGATSDAVFESMCKIAKAGVVGANIEDYSGSKAKPLYSVEEGAERIAAAREAVSKLAHPFIITARAECYLTGHPTPFAESIKRINRYYEAGADCLFVPGIKDLATIKALVQEANGPVSVVMGLSGAPISLNELEDVGVRRISIGGSLARATLGLARQAANEMLTSGTFSFSNLQIADQELCQLFGKNNS